MLKNQRNKCILCGKLTEKSIFMITSTQTARIVLLENLYTEGECKGEFTLQKIFRGTENFPKRTKKKVKMS